MSRLAGDLNDEAIGESDRSLACERRVRPSDDVLILQGEAIVLYELLTAVPMRWRFSP